MVMECHRSYAVLLDEDGRFHAAANLHYEVGQTVTDPVLMLKKPGQRSRRMILIGRLIAVMLICLLTVLGIGLYRNHAVCSSVYISINPELRMDLNRKGDPIELEGLNEDGEELLDDYEWEGKDKLLIASQLIDRARDMGYLNNGKTVSVFIDTPDGERYAEYEAQFRNTFGKFTAVSFGITGNMDTRHDDDLLPAAESQNAFSPQEDIRDEEPDDHRDDDDFDDDDRDDDRDDDDFDDDDRDDD